MRWQVWRTVKRRGFVRVYASNADRAECASLGCWLRCVREGAALRVRIATGPLGDELFATELEREQRERAEKERVTAERDASLRELEALRSERGKQS